MVKTNTRWPLLHFIHWRGLKSILHQNKNTISILPHHNYLSFINCYKAISCKYWTGLSKKPHLIHWAFRNAWKPVPAGNEIKTFKLLANKECTRSSFWIKIVQQSNAICLNSNLNREKKKKSKRNIFLRVLFKRCSEISWNCLEQTVIRTKTKIVTAYL